MTAMPSSPISLPPICNSSKLQFAISSSATVRAPIREELYYIRRQKFSRNEILGVIAIGFLII